MKQIAVIGIGDFGYNLIETLSKGDAQIIAIDIDKAKVAKVKDVVTHAVQLDSTNESALMEAGFADIDAAVVCMG
ncbi:MAG: NAD-binding protein, partial [Deltaproteobacteria bacterium]